VGTVVKYSAISGLSKPISRLVLGTARLTDFNSSLHDLNAAYSAGYTTFDSARAYGGGAAEVCLGRWLSQSRELNKDAVIITKGGHPTSYSRLRPDYLREDIEASLRALSVDILDCFLLHRDDEAVPVADVVGCLADLVRAGKIRTFGFSNWSASRVEQALACPSPRISHPIAMVSLQFSLATWRFPPWPGCVSIGGPKGYADRTWYADHHIPVLAWSPLGAGVLTESACLGKTNDPRRLRMPYEAEIVNRGRFQRARALARQYSVSVSVIALAYLFSRNQEIYPVLSSTNVRHLVENTSSLDLLLSPDECSWLEGLGSD
jgi:1-deoxyxylulose-5-phosphate synthase